MTKNIFNSIYCQYYTTSLFKMQVLFKNFLNIFFIMDFTEGVSLVVDIYRFTDGYYEYVCILLYFKVVLVWNV